LVAAYGSKPTNWPTAERAAAEALLARSPEARAALAEAEPLDTLLDAVPAVAPSPALRAAVVAGMPQSVRSGRGSRWQGLRDLLGEFGALPAVRPLLFASLLLGLFAGYFSEDNSTTDTNTDLVQLAVYDGAYAEY
jgi:ferric-dicitrate binding protein FerR (iron transport regulator)